MGYRLLNYLVGIFLLSSTATANPSIKQIETFYPIRGNSIMELQHQMDALGPYERGQRFNASTRWYVTWKYNYRIIKNLCHITNVSIHVDVIYHYPQWGEQNKAVTPVKSQWDAILNQLRNHERGHGKNGKAAGMAIEQALQKMSAKETCAALTSAINRRALNLIDQYNNVDIQYDDITQHGLINP